MENVKIENLLCDILGDFQTLWVQQKVTFKVTITLFAPCKQSFTTLLASLTSSKDTKLGRKFGFFEGGYIMDLLQLLLYSPNFFCWKQKNAVSAASNQQERCYLLTKCDKKHIRSCVFVSQQKYKSRLRLSFLLFFMAVVFFSPNHNLG